MTLLQLMGITFKSNPNSAVMWKGGEGEGSMFAQPPAATTVLPIVADKIPDAAPVKQWAHTEDGQLIPPSITALNSVRGGK